MEFDNKRIELENGIVGIFCSPKKEGQVPAILMLHGFASHKDEIGDLFRNLAERIVSHGIASLRIDFRGWGESAGDMADTNVDTLLEDAQTGLKFLERHEHIDEKRLGVLGFSLGGATAVLMASENPDKIKSLATWSSAGELEKDFRRSLGDEAFEAAQRDGGIEVDLGWRKVRLKQSFFESLERYAPIEAIRTYPSAFFNVAGTEDFSADYLETYNENARGETKAKLLIKEADHIFNVLEEGAPFAEQVLQATNNWFARTL